MEILHDGTDRRTILLAVDSSAEGDEFERLLSEDFDVIRVGSAEECLEVMDGRYTALSVTVIDVDMAKADDYAFLRAVSGSKKFDTVPVIVTTNHEIEEDDARCLAEGALDFITPPYRSDLVKRRVENAVLVKGSATFNEIEAILRVLPSGIYYKDAQGRYLFSTHFWERFKRDGDPNWTICGKTDLDIRDDRENALKAMEADREIVRTGKGTTYVIEDVSLDGEQEFIELVKRPVFDADGKVKGIVGLVNNITEHVAFQLALERDALLDGLTGVENRRAFDDCVAGIGQDRRLPFPIAVISADCDELKRVNDTFGHLSGDEYIRASALTIKSCLPDGSRVFRMGGDEFVAFVPGVGMEEAERLVATIKERIDKVRIGDGHVSVSFGVAEIDGPEADVHSVIAVADRDMYRNKSASKAQR